MTKLVEDYDLSGAPPPADICTGNYFYKDACGDWRVCWPGQGPVNGEAQGCGDHARMVHDASDGVWYFIVGQGAGGTRYPRPVATATFAAARWDDCYVQHQTGGNYSSCALPGIPGVQNPIKVPLSFPLIPAGQAASWKATFKCNEPPPILTTYCPDDPITRGQMAAFIKNTVEWMVAHPGQLLPTTTTQQFSDVSPSNQFFDAINSIHLAGITAGKSPCLPVAMP